MQRLVLDVVIRYVCVTDQPLKSDVWEIQREYFPFVKSDRDKFALVKMQPFQFEAGNVLLRRRYVCRFG